MSTSLSGSRPPIHWTYILPLLVLKLGLHLYANPVYGFHRDEFLYLALGQHPDVGYWSVPPLIGWLSWLVQNTLGDSIGVVRLFPTLAGTGLMLLTALLAREFGGGRWAQFVAALGVLVAPVFMRTSMLFQPVIFDIFFWTLALYWLVRYLNEERDKFILAFFLTLGFGLLNKYLIGFLLVGVVLAFLISPRRSVFIKRSSWLGLGLLVLMVLPNIWWQVHYDFPVVTHMRQLRTYQLVNVSTTQFLIDQLLLTLTGVFLWLPGLYWLLVGKGKRYRLVGLIFPIVLLLLILFSAKSYYSAGLYPVLLGAGAVAWEQAFRDRRLLRWGLPILQLVFTWPFVPFGVSMLPPEQMIRYGRWASQNVGMETLLTWEDGERYDLPQDYADMFGWEELGDLVVQAWEAAPEPERTILYCENYGQAGAAMRFAVPAGVVEPVSFNGSFAIWAPVEVDAHTLIYVNDELGEDIQALFADIRLIGQIENPYARERGAGVYLCQSPRASFSMLWGERIREVKAELGIQVE